ncbi:hypothetical protein GJ744_008947 [Endocarpon pusillum]|uniref:Uncharacterized protein n=1 Tax=Endocarpon pusillum TaxID=364733 RepID=A0A8H7AP99_9EURO|nr:hypothetical protein GJ744_008947 [Endocarpon pusillum]
MSRLNASLPPFNSAASIIVSPFTTSCRTQSSRTKRSIANSAPRCRLTQERSRTYATVTTQHPTSYLTIPKPSTSTHRTRTLTPPSLDQIRANLPKPQTPSTPKILVGTVSRVGTMSKTVQISYNTQRFDNWLKRHIQHPTRILAHEPTGYLHVGDVVEFARFTPATMADRYESGKLNRRGGGVRFEVYRVITPFGQPVEERKELHGKGELWENLGVVEFERRKNELSRPWNQDRKRKVALMEGMCEALSLDLEKMRLQLGVTSKPSEDPDQAATDVQELVYDSAGLEPVDGSLDEMSEAQRGIAAEGQKLQENTRPAHMEQS